MKLALWLCAMTGCVPFGSSELDVTRVEPASGPNTVDVPVRIAGAGFHLPLTTNLDNGATAVGTLTVNVGDASLSDLALRDDQLIEGSVPAGLPVGSYDVTVTIGDNSDTLAAGYTVEACQLPCPLGCDASNTRCLELVPSNGIDPTWVTMGTAPLLATTNLVIDTDAGTITPAVPGVVYQQVDPIDCGSGALVGIGAFSFTSVTIASGVTVRVVGTRAFALLASGPIEIDGVLDASGGLAWGTCTDANRCAGPGGFVGGLYDPFNPESGRGPGGGGHGYSANGPGDEPGGGGGASCGAGGLGGDVGDPAYPPGAGGIAYGAPELVPLCGGSGGGAGGPASFIGDPGSRGGGGGGAVQLVSGTSVTIAPAFATPTGITVGGGGGQGDKAATIDDGGGGGGAGGSILIEAPTVTIGSGAVLAANGGGGAGGYNSGAIATDGTQGQLSTTAAPGGTGVRPGGTGAAGSMVDGQAAPGPSGDGGAGGGGGAGRIRLNTRSAMSTVIAGDLSPALGTCTSSGVIVTR